MSFHEIDPKALAVNPFSVIGDEWLLLSAGDASGCNTMTASWGALGVLWGKNTATCYVRPTRYTREFMEENSLFTITVLKEGYRDALALCGRVSGRDCDKIAKAGLHPVYLDGTVGFEEARLTLVCRKMAVSRFDPAEFLDAEIDARWYPQKDYHYIYYGEILKAYADEA